MPTLQIMIRRNVMSSIRGLISTGLILITIQLIKQALTAWQTDIMYLCLPNFYMDFMIADKGAGLDDFWDSYKSNPLFAGGFLWTYVDEAVKRTDLGGRLDSDGP